MGPDPRRIRADEAARSCPIGAIVAPFIGMIEQSDDDVRVFVRDVGVRAALLSVGGLIVTGSVAALALKAASGMVKVALGTSIAMICGGVAAWELKKIRQYVQQT